MKQNERKACKNEPLKRIRGPFIEEETINHIGGYEYGDKEEIQPDVVYGHINSFDDFRAGDERLLKQYRWDEDGQYRRRRQ
ncbi:hypothetical protein GCM10010911_13850 [Paenibacillus nasutitermitis]|uniref:Uncharacterized protein n=1 Tax=Paenibacillus nasutitermitis TaxID=1652958 RepID=A0A916YR38_9BACL|nr:hypothetical protein GCM10010911_13850 [Paenibacillus nasutitermitis]